VGRRDVFGVRGAWAAVPLVTVIIVAGCGDDAGGGAGGSGGETTTATSSATGATSTTAATGGSSGSSGSGGATSSSAATGSTTSTGAGGTGGTEGEGIAARYPGDVGIEEHPDVILADGFEDYAVPDDLYARWDAVYQVDQIAFATGDDDVFTGTQSLQFTVPQQESELSNAVDAILAEERDTLYLRYLAKFQPPYDVVGSSHNGAMISAHYFIDGQATPGVPADGTNKFLVNLEHWRGEVETASPGLLNLYVYHPEQRSQWGDHFFPSGVVLPNSSVPGDFGPEFVARPEVPGTLGEWTCFEYMVHANTPGQRDGRVTVWVDGALVADFPNLRFRDVESLRLDRFGLSFHIGSNTAGESRRWYDNVVAATSYIGPVAP
jgi:hypothetical protein